MIKAVLFDCFGVLVTDAWLPFKQQHFGDDATKFQQATDITKQANQGIISQQAFVDKIADLAGVSSTEVAKTISRNLPNEKLFSYIVELKDNYKIGLLSNIAGDYLSRMFTPEQLALFDGTSLSFENGFVKPEAEAYAQMAKVLNVDVSECVMVDDQERQVTGARLAGMEAVLYEDFEQFKTDLNKILANR